MPHLNTRRQKLFENVTLFKQAMKAFDCLDVSGPIQGIVLGSSEKALECTETLKSFGIAALAVRPPTVAENAARLRLTLRSSHCKEDFEQLAKGFENL